MTKYEQNYYFEATTPFKYIRQKLLSMKKTYWGSVKYF